MPSTSTTLGSSGVWIGESFGKAAIQNEKAYRNTREEHAMASPGKELLGEHYNDEHLSYEEIENLDLKVVTAEGRVITAEDMRGRVFRIADPDEPSGYVVKPAEDPEASPGLCYLQRA
jgi:hypothetical protein